MDVLATRRKRFCAGPSLVLAFITTASQPSQQKARWRGETGPQSQQDSHFLSLLPSLFCQFKCRERGCDILRMLLIHLLGLASQGLCLLLQRLLRNSQSYVSYHRHRLSLNSSRLPSHVLEPLPLCPISSVSVALAMPCCMVSLPTYISHCSLLLMGAGFLFRI